MMKEMDTKKIMATFAILMIVLGVAGFAYAHWSEFLYLNGTVSTGRVCVEWSFNATLPPSNLKDLDGDGEKDDPVAVLTYSMRDQDQDGCNDTLDVTLRNAYPSLTVEGMIDVHNCGTIPVGIADYDWNITDPNGIAGAVELVNVDFYLKAPNGTIYPITMDIEVWIQEVNQIDPCWSLVCEFEIHFTENLPENATATISAWIEFWNWNEL
ncbi:MAG: hypothetical protein QXL57_07870 [Candidatus Bathyarchaeia archaeon]